MRPLSLTLLALVAAAPAGDKFTSLWPDKYNMPTDSYSGYLTVSTTKELHYILVSSKNDPKNDPVVFWFNGGPGCSSLLGFMQENGPLIIDDFETEVKENPFPWNANANVVYLEAPAGVGFSRGADEKSRTHNDMSSSMDNFKALQAFYDKFPELLPN
jgi:carboxypeptidase C (cathepsin A)